MINARLPQAWEMFLADILNLEEFYRDLDSFLCGFQSIIPEPELIFHVFRRIQPQQVRCVLYGEDPYPRITSACGIAFWDREIENWDQKTQGNSLKNMMKALLVFQGWADYNTTAQECRKIARDKNIKSPPALFEHWLHQGVFLINTALSFSGKANKADHFRFWKPFHEVIIRKLGQLDSSPYYVLWGNKAASWEQLIRKNIDNPGKIIKQSHPTFIHQFLDKSDVRYSPFTELARKTQIQWI